MLGTRATLRRRRRRSKTKKAGNDLLSHTVTHAVPSTLKSLTSEFGMGSGVASSLLSPARFSKKGLRYQGFLSEYSNSNPLASKGWGGD